MKPAVSTGQISMDSAASSLDLTMKFDSSPMRPTPTEEIPTPLSSSDALLHQLDRVTPTNDWNMQSQGEHKPHLPTKQNLSFSFPDSDLALQVSLVGRSFLQFAKERLGEQVCSL